MLLQRLAVASPIALFFAAGTLLLMQILIRQPLLGELTESNHTWLQPRVPDVIEPPPPIEQLPPKDWTKPIEVPGFTTNRLPVDTLRLPRLPTAERPDFAVTAGPVAITDSPLIAVVRVAPNYPPPMAQRGIEGDVDVLFDVLASGLVVNVRVTASSHRGFEKAAVDAARRFRFEPRVVDGVAVAIESVAYRFRFELSERQ